MSQPLYRRVLLKLSGEALQGDKPQGLDPNTINRISNEIVDLTKHGVEVGIVVGGGNFISR